MSSRPFWGLEWDLVSIFPPTKGVKQFPINVDSASNKKLVFHNLVEGANILYKGKQLHRQLALR